MGRGDRPPVSPLNFALGNEFYLMGQQAKVHPRTNRLRAAEWVRDLWRRTPD
jgi:hypothetical protein